MVTGRRSWCVQACLAGGGVLAGAAAGSPTGFRRGTPAVPARLTVGQRELAAWLGRSGTVGVRAGGLQWYPDPGRDVGDLLARREGAPFDLLWARGGGGLECRVGRELVAFALHLGG